MAPVPLTVYRSNPKFDKHSQCCGLNSAQSITTKFCTYHNSNTVVMCAKFRCDRPLTFVKFYWTSNSTEISLVGWAQVSSPVNVRQIDLLFYWHIYQMIPTLDTRNYAHLTFRLSLQDRSQFAGAWRRVSQTGHIPLILHRNLHTRKAWHCVIWWT